MEDSMSDSGSNPGLTDAQDLAIAASTAGATAIGATMAVDDAPDRAPVPERPIADTVDATPSAEPAPAGPDDWGLEPAVVDADGSQVEQRSNEASAEADDGADGDSADAEAPAGAAKKRRRGSRGGKRRKKPSDGSAEDDDVDDDGEADTEAASEPLPAPATADEPRRQAGTGQTSTGQRRAPRAPKVPDASSSAADPIELPERLSEGRPKDVAAAAGALVPKMPPPRPRIGDTRPAPADAAPKPEPRADKQSAKGKAKNKQKEQAGTAALQATPAAPAAGPAESRNKRKRGGQKARAERQSAADLDAEIAERRRGRERNGRPVGRYAMAVQVRSGLTQVAVLEGRSLIEHYVSRPADDISQIHGNIYLGRVQNVLPGMEAAFVDIATPKNAVLYRGDVQYDKEDVVEGSSKDARIEQLLRSRQMIVCQVTKNPIGAKGARLTQEVSLPGRFVVLIPNSTTYGISKRLPDDERKRLRSILDRVKPAEHGIIVRTAAETATEHELRADVLRLVETWNDISKKADAARKANRPALLYREPELAVRVIREEFNADYRSITIDDRALYDEVRSYVGAMNPELADRVEFHDAATDGLPLYERLHIHEQVHKALDRKVWLPSGGSLIIEHTEALTVIDVNTGKNVGSTNLETTVFHNNLEAADEIARQLRLRDIGGIIVIDFIDMEIKDNRKKVVESFRAALARDKTRTQVFDISELGLVEMTRKRIGEGLLTNFADQCPNCDGRGVVVDLKLLQ